MQANGKKHPSIMCALPLRDIIAKPEFFVHVKTKCYHGRSALEKNPAGLKVIQKSKVIQVQERSDVADR